MYFYCHQTRKAENYLIINDNDDSCILICTEMTREAKKRSTFQLESKFGHLGKQQL